MVRIIQKYDFGKVSSYIHMTAAMVYPPSYSEDPSAAVAADAKAMFLIAIQNLTCSLPTLSEKK